MLSPIEVEFIWTAETEPDWSSRLIMKSMGTPYSHVAMVLDGRIYHAVDKGVCEESFEEFMRTHKIVARKMVALNCSAEAFKAYMKRASGTEYSQSQLAVHGALLMLPIGPLGRGALKWAFRNGRGKSICSEIAGDVLNDLQEFYKLEGDPDWDWTPAYLETVLQPARTA